MLVNDEVVGTLSAGVLQDYSFRVAAAGLRKVNTLGFRFHDTDDGMYSSSPVITFQNKSFRDPRDEAIKEVRVAHGGTTAADWGGFFVGDGDWIEATFVRKQETFCFILAEEELSRLGAVKLLRSKFTSCFRINSPRFQTRFGTETR